MTKENILLFLKENKEKLESFGVKRIGLFGSFVKGEQKGSSDIDVFVVFKNDCEGFDNYFDLKFYLEDSLQTEVDLVIKNTLKRHIKERVLAEVEYA